MKKAMALILSMMMAMGLTACSGDNGSSQSAGGSQASGSSSAVQSEETNGAASNVLVVYYSATGNTEEAADYIAELTGGDLFELEPTDPYTDADLDYGDPDSRVSREYADERLRDVALVADTVENWEDYDTVFVGYPIWWGIAAWPVDTFVEANDFTGKTVIPFCTSASSGLGQSGELLAELAGTGDWQEGTRFRSSVSEDDVRTWLDELGL